MSGTIQYTIRPYDTIWMLAQIFNTTVDSVMELNPGIDPRNLQIGHIITIRPGFQYYPPYSGVPQFDEMPMPRSGNMNGMPQNGMPLNGMPLNGMPMPRSGNLNGNMMNNNMMNGLPRSGNMMDGDMAELRSYFHMLWDQHVTWTLIAIIAILNDLPQTELIKQRLLRNATDFGDALIPYYGEEEVQGLVDLFTEHITIAADLVQAAKDGDTTGYNEIEQRWYDNANQIAAYLSNMNPHWSEDDWSAMMEEHLALLAATVGDMVAQNYESAINRYDDIQIQALEMADMMAEGIMEQFPNM